MATQAKTLSVIMAVYNGEKYLEQAVESILGQTIKGFDFIIINDGSTDNTLKILRSYKDSRIRIMNNEANVGLAEALNRGLAHTNAEYIARQDADDLSTPSRLYRQLDYMVRNPDVALLGTSVLHINERGEVTGGRIQSPKPLRKILKANHFAHGSAMFKREVVRGVGGYDELLRYAQDYDLWLRMIRQGYRAENLTEQLYALRLNDGERSLGQIEEAALYHVLVLKMNDGTISRAEAQRVSNNGIRNLLPLLGNGEEALYQKLVAHKLVKGGRIKTARGYYWRSCKKRPSCSVLISLCMATLGEGKLKNAHKAVELLRNIRNSSGNILKGRTPCQ